MNTKIKMEKKVIDQRRFYILSNLVSINDVTKEILGNADNQDQTYPPTQTRLCYVILMIY